MARTIRTGTLNGDVLAQTAVFGVLGRRRCATLTLRAVERSHSKGDVIFREDSVAAGLILLARGDLRLTFKTALGGSVMLSEPTAPAVIVTAGLLDGGLNGATGVALSPCTIYVLLREAFLEICHANPEVVIRLLSEIGGHLRRTSAFVDLMTVTGICQRLARVLLELMQEAGSPRFLLPCSREELAARLGTVRELIYRNLKLLETRGVLHFAGKEIIVTDAPALVSAAGACAGAGRAFEPHAAPPIPACFVLESLRKKRILNHIARNEGEPLCPLPR